MTLRLSWNKANYCSLEIADKRTLWQEAVGNEELAAYIANAVLKALGRKSFRQVIRISRKSKTMEELDETKLALWRYDLK
jgi:hypothetical protein